MSNQLKGKRVAFLATDGVEEVELTEPRMAVEDAGADTAVVSIEPGEIQAFNHLDHGDRIKVDLTTDNADPGQFDALVLPGGVANPDRLRQDEHAIRFIKGFFDQDKPVAVICHGPWTLVEAGVIRGRTLTSWPSLQTDLRNAGAEWVDEEVHVDGRLVSSRKPDDLPSFNRWNRTRGGWRAERDRHGRHRGLHDRVGRLPLPDRVASPDQLVRIAAEGHLPGRWWGAAAPCGGVCRARLCDRQPHGRARERHPRRATHSHRAS